MGRNERLSFTYLIRSSWFFFDSSKHVLGKYSLFETNDKQEDGVSSANIDERSAFNTHWGWWATIHRLSETGILSITGDNCVTDVNFITVLNYLEIQKDIDEVNQRKERIAMSRQKIR